MPPSVAGKNYFELFDLPVSFDVDLAMLTDRYRRLARETHPDRFAGGSDQDRRVAMQTTALVNEALRTLKDPVTRARYMLQLYGVDVGADTDTAMEPAFLMEQIELRERLDEARTAADAGARLQHLAHDVAQRMHKTSDALRDRLACPEKAMQARMLVREMQFLDKLQHEIGDAEAGLS